MTVRPITASDWPFVVSLILDTVAAGETYSYPLDLDADGARALWQAGPNGQTVVAELDGRVAGTATMGPNRPGRGAHVGTASFMVAASARGHGIGRALGRYVIDWHRREGFRSIQFNAVVETNVAAVSLWRSLGFRIIGTVPEAFDSATHGPVGLHIMHLDLTAEVGR